MKSRFEFSSSTVSRLLSVMLLCCSCSLPAQLSAEGNNTIGNAMKVFVEHDSVFLENSAVSQRLQSLVRKLERANEISPGTFSVLVLNDALPNAFSLPGGEIYVSTGLLKVLEDESEVALILSHEMAHAITGDAIAQFEATADKQEAKVIGGSIVAMALIVATAGAAAGAMGPMGAATTQSTMIINVGSVASSQVLFASMQSDTSSRSKLKFAKAEMTYEPQNHPVYMPALVDAVLKGTYEGYGEDKEIAANEASVRMVQAAGYPGVSYGRLKRKLAAAPGQAAQPHLAAYLAVGGEPQ